MAGEVYGNSEGRRCPPAKLISVLIMKKEGFLSKEGALLLLRLFSWYLYFKGRMELLVCNSKMWDREPVSEAYSIYLIGWAGSLDVLQYQSQPPGGGKES